MKLVSLFISAIVLYILLMFTAFTDGYCAESYEECILESMKCVRSDLAALEIMTSCRKMFPKKDDTSKKNRKLTNDEIAKLTGRAGYDSSYYAGNCGGTIYNGNVKVTITKILIPVTTVISGKESTYIYVEEVEVLPLNAAKFRVNILEGDKGAKYTWNIVGAIGH